MFVVSGEAGNVLEGHLPLFSCSWGRACPPEPSEFSYLRLQLTFRSAAPVICFLGNKGETLALQPHAHAHTHPGCHQD